MLCDRRKTKRMRVQLEAGWEGDSGLCGGQVSDISLGGCFILTDGLAKPKELIRVEIELPSKRLVTLWGEVIEFIPEIGFSLCFSGLKKEDESSLNALIALTNNAASRKRIPKQPAETLIVRF